MTDWLISKPPREKGRKLRLLDASEAPDRLGWCQVTDTAEDGFRAVNRYEERTARQGQLQLEPVVAGEDSGRGERWTAAWAPGLDELADVDGAGVTVEEALVSLIYGLGEEVLRLRRDVE